MLEDQFLGDDAPREQAPHIEASGRADPKRIRFTVDLPCITGKKIDDLADKLGITKAELVRRSLQMLTIGAELKEKGFDIGGVKQTDAGRETIILDHLVS